MNVIHSLTLAQMRAKPRRTLTTLIGVALSVAMLTAVFAGADSFLDLMRREAVATLGSWHGQVSNTSGAVAQALAEDDRLNQVALAANWGLDPAEDGSFAGTSLFGVNDAFYELLGVECVEGALPENSRQLAISSELAHLTGWTVGSQVTLDLVRAWSVSGLEADGTPFYHAETGQWSPSPTGLDHTEEVGSARFTVTGVVEMGAFDNGFGVWWPCFTTLDSAPASSRWNVYFTMGTLSNEIWDVMDDIAALQQSQDPEYDAGYNGRATNRSLLLYAGVDEEGSWLLTAFYSLMGVVLAVILIGAVSLARNAFSISLAERTRMLGMLASVGATRAQKRQSVLFEALLLGLAGIPLGLAAGCAGMAVTLPLVSTQVQELFRFHVPLYLSVRPLPLLGAAALAALALLVSALQPAFRASRVSPIDAIRGAGEVRLRPRDLRIGGITRRLFGFTGALALKNCKRSRGRYRSIVFSLALSVVMLLAASGLSYYVDQSVAMRYGRDIPPAHATVGLSDPAVDPAPLLEEMQSRPGAGTCQITGGIDVGMMGSWQVSEQDLSAEARRWLTERSEYRVQMGLEPLASEGAYTVQPTLLVLEDEDFAAWAGRDVTLRTDLLDCVLVTDNYLADLGSFAQLKNALRIEAGFSQTFDQGEGRFADTWRVAALAAEAPANSGDTTLAGDGLTVQLVTSRTVFEAFLARQAAAGRTGNYFWTVLYTDAEDPVQLQESLLEWVGEGDGQENSYRSAGVSDMSSMQSFAFLLRVFCGGFVVLLCLVCAANIHNTVTTGFELRAREYAMLRSVGVTPGGFARMLRLESLFYGIKALCWGLPVGLAVLVAEHRAINLNFYSAFSVPVWGFVLAAAVVFGVCGLSGWAARRRLARQTIVEAIHTTVL